MRSNSPSIRLPEMSFVDLPVAATPLQLGSAGPLDLLVEDYFSPKHSPRRPTYPRVAIPEPIRQSVTFESPTEIHVDSLDTPRLRALSEVDEASREKQRKYRQTLVEIKDDVVFQKVLEDLARLQEVVTPPATPLLDEGMAKARLDPLPGVTAGAYEIGSTSPTRTRAATEDGLVMRPLHTKGITRSPSKIISERKAREQNIKAWFVTREIVQGERRHGRLMARGVAVRRIRLDSVGVPC